MCALIGWLVAGVLGATLIVLDIRFMVRSDQAAHNVRAADDPATRKRLARGLLRDYYVMALLTAGAIACFAAGFVAVDFIHLDPFAWRTLQAFLVLVAVLIGVLAAGWWLNLGSRIVEFYTGVDPEGPLDWGSLVSRGGSAGIGLSDQEVLSNKRTEQNAKR